MNCNDAAGQVAAYADGELGSARGRLVEEHLQDCPACAARHRDVLALRGRMRAELPYFTAPQALEQRLRAAALGESPAAVDARAPRSTARDRRRWIAAGAFAGCAATVIGFVLATAIMERRADDDIAMQAAGAHVRATLGNRTIEVASSDQHTVKPWLSSRLDYSPPVHDFATDGFPLVGARIDTLDKVPVATLVYRYRQHTIDVYVRPESAHGGMHARTIRGFNVAHATGQGMDWLAVSDVSEDVLEAFVQRLARASSTK